MKITVFRIDDRLIHGQIATAWTRYSNAEQIVIADDKVVNDSFQYSLLKMATPKGVGLRVLSLEKAREELANQNVEGPATLFLTRGPVEANEVITDSNVIESINIGNLNMRKGKKKILDNFWVFNEDVEALHSLNNKGIRLEFRTLPNDSTQSVMELLKKL